MEKNGEVSLFDLTAAFPELYIGPTLGGFHKFLANIFIKKFLKLFKYKVSF